MSRRLLALAVLTLVAVFAIAACGSDDSAGTAGAYTVTADEAVEMIESGERTIIDVRSPEEFAAGHVVGAVNINVDGADFESRIAELKHALERLEEGTYGVCESCGKPIDLQRLEALPQTELCIECARSVDPATAGQ